MTSEMTSNKPYLVRAFYQWISDNQLTPYIMVDVSVYGTLVPVAYVNDGQITLNISSAALGNIAMGDEHIEFSARFGGKLEHIVIPYGAVGAIYAKENGAGTSLPIEHSEASEPASKSPFLTSVAAEDNRETTDEVASDESVKPKAKGKPSLKVIK